MRLIFLSTHIETALATDGGRRDDLPEFRQGLQTHSGAVAALPFPFLPKTDMWDSPVQTQSG